MNNDTPLNIKGGEIRNNTAGCVKNQCFPAKAIKPYPRETIRLLKTDSRNYDCIGNEEKCPRGLSFAGWIKLGISKIEYEKQIFWNGLWNKFSVRNIVEKSHLVLQCSVHINNKTMMRVYKSKGYQTRYNPFQFWNHVAFICPPKKQPTIFLNGKKTVIQKLNEESLDITMWMGDQNFKQIGEGDMWIDEVYMWQNVISPHILKQLYNKGNTGISYQSP